MPVNTPLPRRSSQLRNPLGPDKHRTSSTGWLLAFCIGALACSGTAPAPTAAPDLQSLPPLPDLVVPVQEARGAEVEARELTIGFVGEVRGEIEPCGCPTLPYGGFERRERLLGQLRSRQSLLHLDAGETLVKGLITLPSDEREARARDVLLLSKEVGVQAWVPGPSDLLGLGLDGLKAVQSGRIPAPSPISATWEGPDGALLLPPSKVVDVNGVRVGIIGLSAEPSAPEVAGVVSMRDPVEAAKAAVAGLPDDLDLIVGLGSVADADADRVAEAVPRLGLLLTTRGITADEPRAPESDGGGSLIVESSDRGRYLTLVRLRLGSTLDLPVVEHPSRQTWKSLHTAREKRYALSALPEPTPGGPPDADVRDSAKIEAARKEVDRWEAVFAEEGKGRNLGFVASIPLAESLDGESDIAAVVQEVKSEVEGRAELVAREVPTDAPEGFASASACVSCHRSELARWTYSDHNRAAWTSLIHRRETENVECVQCHTTGFGQPGGFGELTSANLGRFKGVQCEACHGPMAGHPDDPRVQARPVTEATCLRCHDEANSPDFDFDSYLRRATCQGGRPEVMDVVP